MFYIYNKNSQQQKICAAHSMSKQQIGVFNVMKKVREIQLFRSVLRGQGNTGQLLLLTPVDSQTRVNGVCYLMFFLKYYFHMGSIEFF